MDKIWKYQNPVSVNFGEGSFEKIPEFIDGRNYALITYSDDQFTSYTHSITKASGKPAILINDIAEYQNQNKCCPVICRHGGHYMDYCCLISVNINIIDQETTLIQNITQ